MYRPSGDGAFVVHLEDTLSGGMSPKRTASSVTNGGDDDADSNSGAFSQVHRQDQDMCSCVASPYTWIVRYVRMHVHIDAAIAVFAGRTCEHFPGTFAIGNQEYVHEPFSETHMHVHACVVVLALYRMHEFFLAPMRLYLGRPDVSCIGTSLWLPVKEL